MQYGISPSEWTIFIQLLEKLDGTCETQGFKYALFEGSLVGVYHNGGPLPWDDDVDVVMGQQDAAKFVQLVRKEQAILLIRAEDSF